MSCFRRCRREHFYRYELAIRPTSTGKALRIGSAVHKGLDARANGKTLDEFVAVATAPYDTLPDWAQSEESVAEWMVEREIVAAMLSGYDWYWNEAEIPDNLNDIETIDSEVIFDLPLVNPETGRSTPIFRRQGAIDKIVKLADGRTAIFEHKTTGDSVDDGSDYWRKLELDQQVSNYFVAGVDMGHAIDTVIYDVLRKPAIRPKKLKSGQRETPEEYGERLLADMGERPDFYFARREIPRLTADLDEYRHELWQMSQDIQNAGRNALWYRNTQQCTSYGRCPYIDHCKNGFPDSIPPGFERVSHLHPELQQEDED